MDVIRHRDLGRSALATHHVYTLHGEIAWGGMATVRLARQTGPHGLSRIVAVKTLLGRSAPDSDFASMFRDEIRVASRVNHPNVVPVLDVVANDDELLLVMEYVHGESVARLLKRCRGAMPPKIASTIMAAVLRGLHAAHLARTEVGEPLHVIHRDVTPHNIVVGVDGTPRLLDFGIAHAAGRIHATRFGQVKGKLAYMAPEQFLNIPVDRRVDIYSAAVSLWEMLAGRRLFDGHKDKIVQMILHQTTEPPGSLQRGIPPQLDAIVLRGLHRDPGQRYPTAREMAIAIERETETVSATELGDWVSRAWGEGRTRREQQIRSIENAVVPSGEDDGTSSAETGSNAATVRRLPSAENLTRALDLEEAGSPATPPPEPPTRPDRPSLFLPVLFPVPGSAPVMADTPRLERAPPESGLRKSVPGVLAVAACLVMVAHFWLGGGRRPDMAPAPLAIPPARPAHSPDIQPLRAPQATAHPAVPAGTGPPAEGVPELSPVTSSRVPALPISALPAGDDEGDTVPPAIPAPGPSPPASTAGPRQPGGNLRQRATSRRAPLRTPAAAAFSPPSRPPNAIVDPGRSPEMATPAPGGDRADADCDPPFVVDSSGIKRFKLACL